MMVLTSFAYGDANGKIFAANDNADSYEAGLLSTNRFTGSLSVIPTKINFQPI